MANSGFYTLISKHHSLYSDAFYQRICAGITLTDNNVIDLLWARIKVVAKDFFEHNMDDTIDCLKADVLLSLYASICYTIDSGIPKQSIISLLKEEDCALENEDSADSEKQNLSHRKSNLSQSYQPKGIGVLLSGQQFNNNALMYFQPFWNTPKEPLPCFNIHDYIRFIKNSTYWPFASHNLNGMSFFDYFKGIRNMSCNSIAYGTTPKNHSFNSEFSYYIFEQLFSPVSLIDNLLLHQKHFSDLFACTDNPFRERSIVLLQPLFQVPHSLWEKLSENYIQALRNYIDHPTDIYSINSLKANMTIPIYYKQYILPLLKIISGNFLYNVYGSDLGIVKGVLRNYLSKHMELLNYQSTFQERMNALAEAKYPTKSSTAIDSMGNYLLEEYKYQNLDAENKKSVSKPKEPKGNDSKRNNHSILSYETNFTYQFFDLPEKPDFFDYSTQHNYYNMSLYLSEQIAIIMNEAKQIQNSFSTINYLQAIAANNQMIFSGTIENM